MIMNLETLYDIFLDHPVVTTDSRNCPAGSLFFALRGENFNGNRFAGQTLDNGCAYAVIDDPEYAEAGNDRLILVGDSLRTLQQLANHHRRQLGTKMIGITGTNGKTTTKELIAAVLSRKYRVLYTQGNLNNPIGVPLTLLRLEKEHELAIIEMGASHPGDIRELAEIAEPDYGIITNVGKAHLEGFGSFEGVVRTKGELYDYLRGKKDSVVFIPQGNPYLNAISDGLNLIAYGNDASAYGNDTSAYVIGTVTGNTPFLAFEWKRGNGETVYPVQTRLIGEYNFDNALAAVAIGSYLGVEPENINRALEEYTPQNNRSQLMETGKNHLIIDAYNANPTSMAASLENFRKMEVPHKSVILGDMKELGAASGEEHEKIVDLVGRCGFERVILVGEAFGRVQSNYETFRDVEELISVLQENGIEGNYVLIKGSNSMKLVRAADYL